MVSNGTTIPVASPGVANIRIIDPSQGQSCGGTGGEVTVSEVPLTFNVTGPAGPVGLAGTNGSAGTNWSAGTNGSPGPAGSSTGTAGGGGADTTSEIFITLRPASGPHVGPIAINHVAFEATNAANIGSAGAGAGAGKVKFGARELHKAIDATSPVLFKALAAGQHFAHATVFVRGRAGGGGATDQREYRMAQVFVTRVAQSTTTTRPEETIQLAFGAVQLVAFTRSPSGKPQGRVVAGWDQIKNTPFRRRRSSRPPEVGGQGPGHPRARRRQDRFWPTGRAGRAVISRSVRSRAPVSPK